MTIHNSNFSKREPAGGRYVETSCNTCKVCGHMTLVPLDKQCPCAYCEAKQLVIRDETVKAMGAGIGYFLDAISDACNNPVALAPVLSPEPTLGRVIVMDNIGTRFTISGGEVIELDDSPDDHWYHDNPNY